MHFDAKDRSSDWLYATTTTALPSSRLVPAFWLRLYSLLLSLLLKVQCSNLLMTHFDVSLFAGKALFELNQFHFSMLRK